MAMSNGKADLMAGPCQHMMQAYFGGLDTAAQGFDPVYKSLAQANLEAIGLANRRVQAYLEVPARLSACRTPQELIAEQMRFWQTAMTQYQDSSRKILTLWTKAVPEFPFASPNSRKPERDYITFPEPQGSQRQDDSDRRAA